MRLEIKSKEEVRIFLKGNKVFIFSCDNCSFVDIEDKNRKIFSYLDDFGLEVMGIYNLAKEKCNVGALKNILREEKENLEKAESIITFTCGGFPQILPNYLNKPVVTATNTLKIEPGRSLGSFARLCSACGECWISWTGNLCMEKLCPKKMRNGPCGGSKYGICEVYDRLCPWIILYKTKKFTENDFLRVIPPKDFSKILLQE